MTEPTRSPAAHESDVEPEVEQQQADAEQQPDAAVPWAMQIAVRYDKSALPQEISVCEVTARAVLELLADPRAVDGEWAGAVAAWEGTHIRKLVRRARGIRWDKAQSVPGVTVGEGPAQARAFVPGPVRPLPPEIDTLQVSGTSYPADQPSSVEDPVLVTVAISPLVDMTSGKAAAQCAHAAQRAYRALQRDSPDLASAWQRDGFRLKVIRPTRQEWADWEDAPVHIIDAGFTELDGPTETTRARW